MAYFFSITFSFYVSHSFIFKYYEKNENISNSNKTISKNVLEYYILVFQN